MNKKKNTDKLELTSADSEAFVKKIVAGVNSFFAYFCELRFVFQYVLIRIYNV